MHLSSCLLIWVSSCIKNQFPFYCLHLPFWSIIVFKIFNINILCFFIRKYAKAETLLTVTDPVHDIAFAPNLGRSFHILAIATKDVRIFTLKPVRWVSETTTLKILLPFALFAFVEESVEARMIWIIDS